MPGRFPSCGLQVEIDELDAELSEELRYVAVVCEARACDAAASGPVPLELISPAGKAAGKKRLETLQKQAQELKVNIDPASPALADVDEPEFLAMVIALAHSEVRCSNTCGSCSRMPCTMQQHWLQRHLPWVFSCYRSTHSPIGTDALAIGATSMQFCSASMQVRRVSGKALHELEVVLLIRFKLMKQSHRAGTVRKLRTRAEVSTTHVKRHISTALAWYMHAAAVVQQLTQTQGADFVRATVPRWQEVSAWLQRPWSLGHCTDANSLDAATDVAFQALMGPAGVFLLCGN